MLFIQNNDKKLQVLTLTNELVYLMKEISAPRAINPLAQRKAKEVLIFGMKFEKFKKMYSDYFLINECDGNLIFKIKVKDLVIALE